MSDADRIAWLERAVSRLQAAQATTGHPKHVRLAKTVAGTGGYPSRNNTPNTYHIVFLDGTFSTSAAGYVEPDFSTRQNAARTVAHNLNAGYLPENTVVLAFWNAIPGGGEGESAAVGGRWWITDAHKPLQLWEQTEDITFTTTAGEAPYTNAKPVLWDRATDLYAIDAAATAQPIWFPGAPRRSDGKYCTVPLGLAGDRWWCTTNANGYLEVINDLRGPYPFQMHADEGITYSASDMVPPSMLADPLDRTTGGVYGGPIDDHTQRERLYFVSAPRRGMDDNDAGKYYRLPAYTLEGIHHAVFRNGVWEVIDTPRWKALARLYDVWVYPTSAPTIPYSLGAKLVTNPIARTLDSETLTIYNPRAIYNEGTSTYYGLPRGKNGQWVEVEYSVHDSGWYVTEEDRGPWKGVLYEQLDAGSYAECDIPASGAGSVRVRVYDERSGGTDNLAAGTVVLVMWIKDQLHIGVVAAFCGSETA